MADFRVLLPSANQGLSRMRISCKEQNKLFFSIIFNNSLTHRYLDVLGVLVLCLTVCAFDILVMITDNVVSDNKGKKQQSKLHEF